MIKRILFFILLGIQTSWADTVEPVTVCLPSPNATLTPKMRKDIATWLGFQKDAAGKCTLCGGQYVEPVLAGISPTLPNPDDMKVEADDATLTQDGQSILKGNVVVEQPNREMQADTAYIFRDAKTEQVTKVDLVGHVMVREPGKLMYGTSGHYFPNQSKGDVDNALYWLRLKQPRTMDGVTPSLEAWGQASSIHREIEVYELKDASYTTCAPEDNSWTVKAKKLVLNKETGRGEAYDATLNWHDTPFFYFPYYNFPIDDRRESGFLTPMAGYSNNLGFNISAPFYWNMAPNYDMVITPNYFSERGLNMQDNFRYLTESSRGQIMFSGIMNDQKFKQFVDDNQPEIGDVSDNRYEVYFKNNTQINPSLSLNAQYHHVSDDYYLQNFGTSVGETTENQLLQQVDLDYTSEHWNSILMMQHYQTLNPINQTPVGEVYSRYPQWILNGDYANLPGGLNFFINNEYDNFVWTSDDETAQPLGERLHTNPMFSKNFASLSGYVKPTVQIQETNYSLTQNTGDLPESFNILVPQTSLDSSVYFDREVALGGHSWTQTFEPRFYYLYVPEVNQAEVPNFDSAYNTFTYDQLFRANRFSGLDRVGDANQVSLAVMSRFLDADTGNETFHWGIGQTYYFQDRQVQLMQQTDPSQVYADSSTIAGYVDPTAPTSPIASQIAYYFSPMLSLTGDGAWDPNEQETNNATINMHYQPGINKIINVGYSFLVNGDQTGITDPSTQNGNLNQAILSAAWPLGKSKQWSTLGSWTQNISHDYPMSYSAGLQYEDCCWALRFMMGKLYTNLDENNQPVYNNSVYLQFVLKGLGNIASSAPSFVSNIAGYQDIFAR